HAGLVVGQGLDVTGVGHVLLDGLDAGGVGLGDQVQPGQVLRSGDVLGVLGAHLDRGAGEVVGAGEVDDLEALRGDRVRRDHAVHGAVLDHGLAGVDGGVDIVDAVLAALAQAVAGQQLGDAGVEADDLIGAGSDQGEHLVGGGAAPEQLAALLGGGRALARSDGVVVGDRPGGDHVGVRAGVGAPVGGPAALLAVVTSEGGPLAGIGGAGGQGGQRQRGGGRDQGAASGSEGRTGHVGLHFS